MAKLDILNVIWLAGGCCEGCTISVVGDNSVVPLEALLAGSVPGLPKLVLFHAVLAPECGDDFIENYRKAERGELDPFALVVEASLTDDTSSEGGYWQGIGRENGKPITIGQWIERLAPKAAVVIAVGDCAVFGGPHSIDANPTGAHGVTQYLPLDYTSTLGLPVINLPGCAVPQVFIATVAALLKAVQGEGPIPELDELGRPKAFYKIGIEEDFDVLP